MWRVYGDPVKRALLLLLTFSLVACQPGLANQDGRMLEASIGTFTWGKEGPIGTALVVVSRPAPESPYGPRARSFKLYPPRTWNNGEPISLSARWVVIVGEHPTWHFVGWYLWPDKPPVAGDYTVEAILEGQPVRRTVRLTDLGGLSLSNAVRVDRIKGDGVEASWSPVPGARLYAVAIETSATGFAPRDVPWGDHKVYTTTTSASIRRIDMGNRPSVNRIAVYAFTADFTSIPPQIPTQMKVSWTLSEPFEFPPRP